MAASSPKVRRPISNGKTDNTTDLTAACAKRGALERGGVGTNPLHPHLEGEGGRGRVHAASGARGAARIPIVNLPLLGGGILKK